MASKRLVNLYSRTIPDSSRQCTQGHFASGGFTTVVKYGFYKKFLLLHNVFLHQNVFLFHNVSCSIVFFLICIYFSKAVGCFPLCAKLCILSKTVFLHVTGIYCSTTILSIVSSHSFHGNYFFWKSTGHST